MDQSKTSFDVNTQKLCMLRQADRTDTKKHIERECERPKSPIIQVLTKRDESKQGKTDFMGSILVSCSSEELFISHTFLSNAL